jgi:adenylosuccinate synthase
MAVAHEVERTLRYGLKPVVVRFNGGPQAGHNVRVVRNGKVRHHMHSQFGSGTMLGAGTILTKGMLFSPVVLAEEATRLSAAAEYDIMPTLTVDERCPVVLPMHVRANRAIETSRGDERHGSTGQGIGIARACEHEAAESWPDSVVTVRTLMYPKSLETRMKLWRDWVEDTYRVSLDMSDEYVHDESEWLSRGMRTLVGYGLNVVEDATALVRGLMDDGLHGVTFEGSQGILLDERYGWFPHVTYGDMTPKGAIEVAGGRALSVLGVTRSYQTRHGAGPLPTEGTFDAAEPDNAATEFTGQFRCGLLDLPTLGRSAGAAHVGEVAVGCLDRYPGRYVEAWRSEDRVRGISRSVPRGPIERVADEEALLRAIEDAAGANVTVVGRGDTTAGWSDYQRKE